MSEALLVLTIHQIFTWYVINRFCFYDDDDDDASIIIINNYYYDDDDDASIITKCLQWDTLTRWSVNMTYGILYHVQLVIWWLREIL